MKIHRLRVENFAAIGEVDLATLLEECVRRAFAGQSRPSAVFNRTCSPSGAASAAVMPTRPVGEGAFSVSWNGVRVIANAVGTAAVGDVSRLVLDVDDRTVGARKAYERGEFLASTDERFRPVNMTSGPDGAIYVVDMYRAVIEHPEFVPQELKNRPDERWGEACAAFVVARAAVTEDEPTTIPLFPDAVNWAPSATLPTLPEPAPLFDRDDKNARIAVLCSVGIVEVGFFAFA